jgi:hypothetical protein
MFAIAERKVIERGNLEGKEPVFEYVVDLRLGTYASAKAAKAALIRMMDPDMKGADDDFAAKHFDQQSHNDGTFKIEKVSGGERR